MDVVGARRVLADEGVDHVVLTLYVDGRKTGSAVYGPDAHLGDDVPGVEGAQDQTRFDAWVYIADEGFTGRDEATFEVRRDGKKKTLAVTYSIGDERADDVPLGVEQGALPYAESRVLAQLGAGEDPAPTAPDAEHAVPGKVQTGDEAAWWAVGLGALGAGALVAARRRFGLGEAR
ncbi:hypothetical protein [Micrococcus porci]|uniref:hypothetical protein n=1 Tax=Micrococcus porci TaxID=2856555 RepID=UPI003CF89308